jgi:sugar phosphate isomerase/epimerase
LTINSNVKKEKVTTTLGYSTYALSKLDPFDALPRIRDAGYEALEIAAGDMWPTAPHLFDLGQQKKLAALSKSLGFTSPLLFGLIDVCALDSEMEKTIAKMRMVNELHYDDTPVQITTVVGHSAPAWETGKEQIKDAFLRLADLAAQHGVLIAIEPHAGTDFETPEKAVWLMESAAHPNLKLDLDISHFYVEGAEIAHSVELCAPHSSMIHIKDGEKVDGRVQYCLTGAGNIDIPLFIRSLRKNELGDLPVFAEISQMQSREPDYDPWATAKFCHNALTKAIAQVDAE